MKTPEILDKTLTNNEVTVNNLEVNATKPNKITKANKLKKNLKSYLISLGLFLSSFILYTISLTGCYRTEYECVSEERIKFFYKLGFLVFISAGIFFILLKFLAEKKKWELLIIFSIIYLIQVFIHDGQDMEKHGRINMIGFFLFFSVIFIFEKIFEYFYNQVRKKKYKKLIILASITLSLTITILIVHRTACNGFYKGLGGFEVINNKTLDACYLGKPKTCDIPIFSKISLFDYSRFVTTCKDKRNDKKKFIKYLNEVNPNLKVEKNTYYFPNTNIFDYQESDWDHMYLNVFKNISGVKKKGTHDQFWITFDEKDKGHISIDVPYNKTLVEERRKIALNNTVKFENVYVVYIDSLSRQHFQRKLKKTSKLMDFLLRNRKIKYIDEEYLAYGMEENLKAYQFFKYQSLGYNTPPNYGPMFFGSSPFSPYQSKSIMEQFANKGFITATVVNSCAREAYNIGPQFSHVNFYPSDYEGSSIFCDPHFFNPDDRYSSFIGISSKLRRCFYGRDTGEYILEYILKFLETYKNERKFFRMISNDAHEGTGELIKYFDDALHNFLIQILTKYFDEKTVIIFLSDHGNSLVSGYELMLSDDKNFEKVLGFLNIFLPKNSKYNKIMEYNEQRLVTPYDIFGTFIDILYSRGDKPEIYFNGQTLLDKINGLERSCKNYKELRDYVYCRCFDY